MLLLLVITFSLLLLPRLHLCPRCCSRAQSLPPPLPAPCPHSFLSYPPENGTQTPSPYTAACPPPPTDSDCLVYKRPSHVSHCRRRFTCTLLHIRCCCRRIRRSRLQSSRCRCSAQPASRRLGRGPHTPTSTKDQNPNNHAGAGHGA